MENEKTGTDALKKAGRRTEHGTWPAMRAFHRWFGLGLIFFMLPDLAAQDLTDNPVLLAECPAEKIFQVSGHLRSGLFADRRMFRDLYAEGMLKLEVQANRLGNACAEIRCRSAINNHEKTLFLLREAYVNVFLGRFDLRLGQQVVAWGRADGFNPTDNITPVDFAVFSPDEDDRRLANFLLKGVYNAGQVRVELDWVPVYKPSRLPFADASLPAGITWSDAESSPGWEKNSFALKLDLEKPGIDASLSWFFGNHKLPGIRLSVSNQGAEIFPQAHRTHVLGGDFSTVLGRWGLRGEFALSLPLEKPDSLRSIPCQQWECTLGIEREWGNLNLILQYVGKHVFSLPAKNVSPETIADEIVCWNQMLFSQQKAWSHAVCARSRWILRHETLRGELLGFVNFSSREAFIQPKVAYSLADALLLTVGAQWFRGPDGTLYGFLRHGRNAAFAELKIMF